LQLQLPLNQNRVLAMDKLNATLGCDTVRILCAGPKEAAWKLRAEHRSPRWTTRWDELPRAKTK
jgi:DNA polymerase V